MNSDEFRDPGACDTDFRIGRGSPVRRHCLELPIVISLFSGAGGLDLGFKRAGYRIAVAVDASESAIRTHRRNFPEAKAQVGDLVKLKPNGVVELVKKQIPPGSSVGIIGGPPCQGFSRANTGASVDDPRNGLPKLYCSIIRALRRYYSVEFVVFENVLGMRDNKHAGTYKKFIASIKNSGFVVDESQLCSADFGVPQKRKRIIVTGLRSDVGYSRLQLRTAKKHRTVRDAIGALSEPVYFRRDLQAADIPVHPNHWTMRPKSPKFSKPQRHTGNGRSFRRLHWDKPSSTIAFGHREIHVHPEGHRRLSIFEAMLLQGFPKTFVLEGNLSEQVEQVSNAVPPPLARSVALAVKRALSGR